MSFDSFIPDARTLLATVTAGLTGTIVYHYLTTKYFSSEDDDKSKNLDVLHVDVPKDTVAYLIGRRGETIKQIESENSVSVSFIDSSNASCKLTVIRGSKEGTKKAKEELLKLAQEFAQTETAEIIVSQKIIDLLTANENLIMRDIASASNTRIFLYVLSDKVPSLLVRGTFLNIDHARKLLKSLAEKGISEEKKVAKCLASSITPSNSFGSLKTLPSFEALEATSFDGFCEVMISAIESPSKFFVQRAGPCSKELDRLVESMTEFYEEQKNYLRVDATKLKVGTLVAVYMSDDKNWYRAEVTSIENEASEALYRVSLLDFGDEAVMPSESLAIIAEDFLKLKFQAIECQLANIKPVGSEGAWSDNAIELFDRLTYCTQWKIIMAKIESSRQLHEKQSYSVTLIDTNTEKDINIAQELIDQGFGA